MAVYQDTYLELVETVVKPKDEALMDDEDDKMSKTILNSGILGKGKSGKDYVEKSKTLKVNRPFLFIFTLKQHIVALGRIRDPHWCKLCQ